MKANREFKDDVPAVMRKAVLVIGMAVLTFALAALLALAYEIQGSSEKFVRESVSEIKKVLEPENKEVNAIAALSVAKKFEEEMRTRHLLAVTYELLVHLAIAGIVALIVILFIERQIRKINKRELAEFQGTFDEKIKDLEAHHEKELADYRDAVSKDVWRAVFNRFVPKEVTQQLEMVVDFDFVKRGARYRITLDELPGETIEQQKIKNDELILVKRELWFSVQNISGREIQYPFRCKLLCHNDMQMNIAINTNSGPFPSGQKIGFPRHQQLRLDGASIDLNGREEQIEINELVTLSTTEPIEVYHAYYEVLRTSDETYFLQKSPVLGLEVTVSNRIPDRINVYDIYLAHPERTAFIRMEPPPDEQWVFEERALLPGQMFAVRWKPIQPSSPSLLA